MQECRFLLVDLRFLRNALGPPLVQAPWKAFRKTRNTSFQSHMSFGWLVNLWRNPSEKSKKNLFFRKNKFSLTVRSLVLAFTFGSANRWSVGRSVLSVSVNLKISVNFPWFFLFFSPVFPNFSPPGAFKKTLQKRSLIIIRSETVYLWPACHKKDAGGTSGLLQAQSWSSDQSQAPGDQSIQLGNTVIRTECFKRGNSVSRFHDWCRTIRHFGISRLAVSQAIQNDYITSKLCYFCGQILITIVLEAPLI